MANKSQEEACATLQEILHEGTLTHLTAVCKSTDTVMTEDGMIHNADSILENNRDIASEKRVKLGRMRKELVLGLNGYEAHSLTEANEIIEEKVEEYAGSDKSLGIVRFIREQLQ